MDRMTDPGKRLDLLLGISGTPPPGERVTLRSLPFDIRRAPGGPGIDPFTESPRLELVSYGFQGDPGINDTRSPPPPRPQATGITPRRCGADLPPTSELDPWSRSHDAPSDQRVGALSRWRSWIHEPLGTRRILYLRQRQRLAHPTTCTPPISALPIGGRNRGCHEEEGAERTRC